MSKFLLKIIKETDLYEVASIALVGNHSDRKFAPNINHGGSVHLNILEPSAQAGNHYHQRIKEFFINPGPGKLVLHLKHPTTDNIEVVDILPASHAVVMAYRAKLGVSHMVENPGPERVTLIIIVDEDDPTDVCPSNVYMT